MIADPPSDLLRKEQFWQQLHKIYETVPDAILKILAGDLNVRMHARPSSHTEHVGPHVWGLGEEAILPEPNNRTYLLDFLSTFSMHFPSTFRPLFPSQSISYADMTPLDTFPAPDPSQPLPHQYSRLDDFISPLSRQKSHR